MIEGGLGIRDRLSLQGGGWKRLASTLPIELNGPKPWPELFLSGSELPRPPHKQSLRIMLQGSRHLPSNSPRGNRWNVSYEGSKPDPS